jgi:hypothetical protein
MRITNENRHEYENKDVVSRDGLDLDDNMGDVNFKSLWVKGDIETPKGSRIVVLEDIFHLGKRRAFGGIQCEILYEGVTMIDWILLHERLQTQLGHKLTDAEIRSIVI